jgi:hypothetical protein
MNQHLRRELRDLALVAGGAIPGALVRWQLELVAKTHGGSLRAITAADLLANLIGCLLIGMLLAQPAPPRQALPLGRHRFLRFAHHLLQLDAGAGARHGQRPAPGCAPGAGREFDRRAGPGAAGVQFGPAPVVLSRQAPPPCCERSLVNCWRARWRRGAGKGT